MGNELVTIEKMLQTGDVKEKFEKMLGNRSGMFMSSIISATSQNPALARCDPKSIISSAIIGASLDLPINPNLGFAYIVPYSNKAQFQMGWKGFVQLALRSGNYKKIHVSEVYEDELKLWNPVTGDLELTAIETWKYRKEGKQDKVIGFLATLRQTNGFEKDLYMTKDEITKHGKKYSKSFDSSAGQWKINFNAMAKKTVLKLLLSKFGMLSTEMQKAITSDQAIIDEKGNPDYADNPTSERKAAEPAPKKEPEAKPPMRETEKFERKEILKSINNAITNGFVSADEMKEHCKNTFNKEGFKDLAIEEARELSKWVDNKPIKK